jgi:predicted HicB family RNase H-like nuclease
MKRPSPHMDDQIARRRKRKLPPDQRLFPLRLSRALLEQLRTMAQLRGTSMNSEASEAITERVAAWKASATPTT